MDKIKVDPVIKSFLEEASSKEIPKHLKNGRSAEKLVFDTFAKLFKRGEIQVVASTCSSDQICGIEENMIDNYISMLTENRSNSKGFGRPLDGFIITNEGMLVGIEVKSGDANIAIGSEGVKEDILYIIVTKQWKLLVAKWGEELIDVDLYKERYNQINKELKELTEKYNKLYNEHREETAVDIYNFIRFTTVLRRIIDSSKLKDPESDIYKGYWAPLKGFKDKRKYE